MPQAAGPPTLTDGVVVLTGHTSADVARHLSGEDEETARRFGWWPRHSTEQTVLDAYTLASRRVSEAVGFAAGEVFTSQDGQVFVRYVRDHADEEGE